MPLIVMPTKEAAVKAKQTTHAKMTATSKAAVSHKSVMYISLFHSTILF